MRFLTALALILAARAVELMYGLASAIGEALLALVAFWRLRRQPR